MKRRKQRSKKLGTAAGKKVKVAGKEVEGSFHHFLVQGKRDKAASAEVHKHDAQIKVKSRIFIFARIFILLRKTENIRIF